MRMAMVFAQYRRKVAAQRKEPSFDVSEEPGLSRDELRVLELHARLSPGFALSTSDVAHEFGTRAATRSATSLERLQKLKLLQATVGGLDGETAYTLSAAGRDVAADSPRPAARRLTARPRPALLASSSSSFW